MTRREAEILKEALKVIAPPLVLVTLITVCVYQASEGLWETAAVFFAAVYLENIRRRT